jgi:hypothetical protein
LPYDRYWETFPECSGSSKRDNLGFAAWIPGLMDFKHCKVSFVSSINPSEKRVQSRDSASMLRQLHVWDRVSMLARATAPKQLAMYTINRSFFCSHNGELKICSCFWTNSQTLRDAVMLEQLSMPNSSASPLLVMS